MTLMRAVQYDKYGPPEVLQIRTVDAPTQPAENHVLVRVIASSVNGADISIRRGQLKLLTGNKFPRGVGFDFTGEIVAIGSGVSGYQVGDGIWGFRNQIKQGPVATVAEYVSVPVERVALLPKSIDALTAAALPGVGGAAIGFLRDVAKVKPGERVLIRGAAGGVGSVAVQLAHSMGARVSALVSPHHIQRLKDELGVEKAYDYHTTDPTSLGPFDVILDLIGKNMPTYRKLLAPKGRMVAGIISGPQDLVYITFSNLFSKSHIQFAQKPPTHELLTTLSEYVDNKVIVPVIDTIYSMNEIVEAYRAQEAGGTFGKRIIQINHG